MNNDLTLKSYPAKLLLFGEHTVNLGSKALAVPLFQFSGNWQLKPHLPSGELAKQQMRLPEFAAWLEKLQASGELLCQLDLAAFRQLLSQGLVFESDIPAGYGAGSSGALVAAIFDCFCLEKERLETSLPDLKKALAQMESFFHGTSSGTDPLICYLQKPVLLDGEGVKPATFRKLETFGKFFLLDTGIQRQATPMIEYFLEKSRDVSFRQACQTALLPAVEGAIEAFLAGDEAALFARFHEISEFQLRFLEKMIPPDFRQVWQEGLDGQLFKLKICGAGGGGFLLGFASDFEAMQQTLAGLKILPVVLQPA